MHCLVGDVNHGFRAGQGAVAREGPLLVVKPIATAALTATLSQHVEGVSAGQAVLLCGTPAGGTGLMAGCRKNPE